MKIVSTHPGFVLRVLIEARKVLHNQNLTKEHILEWSSGEIRKATEAHSVVWLSGLRIFVMVPKEQNKNLSTVTGRVCYRS